MVLAVLRVPAAARALKSVLARRFGKDYRVLAVTAPDAALAALGCLADDGGEAALVIADLWLPGTTGVEFLARTRAHQPGAKRALLTPVGDAEASELLYRAMALGQVDLAIAEPWGSPEEKLYPQVGEALAGW